MHKKNHPKPKIEIVSDTRSVYEVFKLDSVENILGYLYEQLKRCELNVENGNKEEHKIACSDMKDAVLKCWDLIPVNNFNPLECPICEVEYCWEHLPDKITCFSCGHINPPSNIKNTKCEKCREITD